MLERKEEVVSEIQPLLFLFAWQRYFTMLRPHPEGQGCCSDCTASLSSERAGRDLQQRWGREGQKTEVNTGTYIKGIWEIRDSLTYRGLCAWGAGNFSLFTTIGTYLQIQTMLSNGCTVTLLYQYSSSPVLE